MKENHILKGNYIKMLGRIIPRENLLPEQVISRFAGDLWTARQHARAEGTNGYFARKARLIEGALGDFEEESAKRRGRRYEVGYEPGLKYIYPGLPVELAVEVDAAIRDTIELVAKCRHVAMTGVCCAGHPSKRMENTMPGSEGHLYSQNISPYIKLVLYRDRDAERLVEELMGIRAQALPDGKAELEIVSDLRRLEPYSKNMMTIMLNGCPTLGLLDGPIEHHEFVPLYQEALAMFWRAVKNVFETAMGERVPGPEWHQFVPKTVVELHEEYGMLSGRNGNGHMLPGYCYFNDNGNDRLITPEPLG